MADPKYITYEIAEKSYSVIIFDPILRHKDIAETILKGYNIISAGFCCLWHDGSELIVNAYGESLTLRKEAKPKWDRRLIKNFLVK